MARVRNHIISYGTASVGTEFADDRFPVALGAHLRCGDREQRIELAGERLFGTILGEPKSMQFFAMDCARFEDFWTRLLSPVLVLWPSLRSNARAGTSNAIAPIGRHLLPTGVAATPCRDCAAVQP